MPSREDAVEIVALYRRGWSVSAIARHTGRDRKTVRAWLRGERARRPPAASVLEPYRAYIERRLADGPHLDATVLLRGLRPLGFERSCPTLTRELRRLGLRPVCEVCKRGGHRLTVELAHEPGRSCNWIGSSSRRRPGANRAMCLSGRSPTRVGSAPSSAGARTSARLAGALDELLRRFGGSARSWRTDRMASVVEPGSGRLRAEAADRPSTTRSRSRSARRGGRSARAWSRPRSVTCSAPGGAAPTRRRRVTRRLPSIAGALRSQTSADATSSRSPRWRRPSSFCRCRRSPTRPSCGPNESSRRARWSRSKATATASRRVWPVRR